MEDRGYAGTVVNVAKDTIRTLSQVYRNQVLCSNTQAASAPYIMGALAVILLAVFHAPILFMQNVREEFYLALELLKGYDPRSYTSQRLWTMIKGLKDIASKLDLSAGHTVDGDDPTSTAITMAGLAGLQVNDNTLSSSGQPVGSMTGDQMGYELGSLFEAAGGYPMIMANHGGMMVNGMVDPNNGLASVGTMTLAAGNEEQLARITRECF